mmetsp:Transcript_20928/g.45599  ORF Transcript_20928/g.45599 Transcript_20928/m.45599 type:complete len:202 (-) Transcript_20928:22-627(-)
MSAMKKVFCNEPGSGCTIDFGATPAKAEFSSSSRSWVRITESAEEAGDEYKEEWTSAVTANMERGGSLAQEAYGDGAAAWKRHQEGKCRACVYFERKVGCRNGAQCRWCHYHHPLSEKRGRPCKSKRATLKKEAEALDDIVEDHPEEFSEAAKKLNARGGYLSHVVKAKLRDFQKKLSEAQDDSQANDERRHSDYSAEVPL